MKTVKESREIEKRKRKAGLFGLLRKCTEAPLGRHTHTLFTLVHRVGLRRFMGSSLDLYDFLSPAPSRPAPPQPRGCVVTRHTPFAALPTPPFPPASPLHCLGVHSSLSLRSQMLPVQRSDLLSSR